MPYDKDGKYFRKPVLKENSESNKKKLLSERKRGYLIAILFGTFGFPLGWITSPLVLYVLNKKLKEKDGKVPNRFLRWALIGIIGAPLSFAPIFLIPTATEEEKAQRIADKVAIAEERALIKELIEEGINFAETGKCPDIKDDPYRELLFIDKFGNYVTEKAESDPWPSFPKDPVPFNKKAWEKCFGKPKLIDTKQVGDGRRFKSKTFRYESIETNVEVNTIKNYIENLIYFYK